MGLSSKKSVTKTDPVFKDQLLDSQKNTQDTYQNNKGTAQDISNQFAGLVPDLLNKYQQGNRTVNAAQDYATNTLQGGYLNGNPYLDNIVNQTNDSVTDRTNAGIGMRGQTGGSAQYEGLSNNLAENEGRLRWQDYNQERQNMNNMAALSPGLASAEQIPLAAAMAAGESAVNLPWVGANNSARNTAGLLGQYTNQEQKQSGGFLGDLLMAGMGGLSSFAMGGGFGGGGGGMLSSLGGPTASGMGAKSLGSLQGTFKNAGGF
jgi:hypothetical protein